jgi:hypothetical protein
MKKAQPWLLLTVVIIGMALAMYLQGRLWICACGYVLFWSGDINGTGNSQHVFDPYTFTHVIHGFLFFAAIQLLWPRLGEDWKLAGAVSLEAVWEMIENSSYVINRYRAETIALGYTGDTILNSMGDLLACALGIMLARRLGLGRTLVLGLAIEAVLLVTVRDNLLLNILMLLYPIDAIRTWQSGH